MKRHRVMLWAVMVFLAIVVAVVVLYPLAVMLAGAFHKDGELSLARMREAVDLSNSANAEALWNSVAVSLLSVVLGLFLGGFLAFVFTQWRFRGSGLLSRLAVLPLALPPLVGVIAFLFVFGESGMLPRILQKIFSSAHVPFYLDGWWAIVVIHVYSFHVYFFLLISNALRQVDGSQLEAASSLGSSQLRTWWHIVLPALRPAIGGASVLTFMASMASFSAPLLFGGEQRFLTTQIYNSKLNGDIDLAAARSAFLLLVSVGFFVLFASMRRSVATRTKGAQRSPRFSLPAGLRGGAIALAVLLVVLELLPVVAIVVISFVREGSWTWQIFPTDFTFENYARLFVDTRIFEPIEHSLLMTLLAVAAAVIVGVAGASLLVKGGLRRSRTLVDVVLTMSFAIPGTVVAIGLIAAFNRPTILTANTILVGTFWILPLAYFIRNYPLVIRSTASVLDTFDDTLLEAGESFGAGVFRRMRVIVLPLILPGILSGALLVAIASLGEFVSSILLYTYASRPIALEILAQLRGYNFGAASAYSVFLLVIILFLTYLAQRIGKNAGTRGGSESLTF
jgi:iron(III) transport system permease protein